MKKRFKILLGILLAAVMLSALSLVSFGADLTYTDQDGNVYTYANSGTKITITGFSTANTDIDLVIPDTIDGLPVVKIDMYAFQKQPLKSVYIPKSITEIQAGAFAYNPTLKTLTFAEGSACTLFNDAFTECGLTRVYVPSGVSLRKNVFSGCVNLKTAVLDTAKGDQVDTFASCTALREATVKTLASGMFYGCENLETVHSTYKFQQLPTDVFNGCEKLTNAMLDEIIDYARLDKIGGSALRGCTSLTYFDFSKLQSNYYYIESHAFADCTGLTEIILPDTLKTFDNVAYTEDVFGGCTGLKRLYLGANFADTPRSIGLQTLSGLETIEVSPENQKYISDCGVLYYRDADEIALLKYPACKKGNTYSTKNVITSPDQVLKIFDYAFSGTQYLKELEFTGDLTLASASITSLYRGKSAFENSSVEKITLRDDYFNRINENMFKGSQIREIDLRKVSSISDSAFENCPNLEKINLLRCSSIGDRAFANCTNLKIAIFGFEKLYIYEETFENDDKITFYCSEPSGPYEFAVEHSIPVNTVNIDISNSGIFPYTGKAICPGVIVSISGMTLTQGKDYVLQYADNTAVGTALVTITFIGDFEGLPEMGKMFTITRQDVGNLTVEYVEDNLYSGEEIRPAVVVKNGDVLLTAGVDYTIHYSSKSDAGTMFFTITGIGNYTGSMDYYYNIRRRDIGEAKIFAIPDSVYTGEENRPIPTITWNSFTLVYGEDFEVNWFDNVNAGFGTVVIYGLGNFSGTARVQFRIFGKDISSADVSAIADQTYTGQTIQPQVTVTADGKVLTENVDYTVEYRNNTESGTASVIIRGIGNYSGVVEKSFTIYKNSVYAFTVFSETQMTATYDGTPLKPEMEVYFGTQLLREGVDYTVRLQNNVNAGTATVTICGIGLFEGERSYDFTILPCLFGAEDIAVDGNTEYNGSAIEPQVTVYKNNKLLENGKEYTVTYSNNVEVGTAYLTVVGIGNYCGTVNLEFEIYAPADSGNVDKDTDKEQGGGQDPLPDDGQSESGQTPQKPQTPDTNSGSPGGNDAAQSGSKAPSAADANTQKDKQEPNAVPAPSIPKTGGDKEDADIVETVLWVCVTVPLLIVLNILDDKWRKKHGKKTFAQRIEDAENDRF